MPEIKHSFISGKMNKDLDERIVPNGEYRDALNIQVSTSEGSDVGAVQNVLGNSIIAGQSQISSDAVCIATIADEKNDKIYWFVKDVANELIDTNLEDPANWVYSSSALTPTHSTDNLVINTIVDPALAQPPLHGDTQYPGFRTRIINDFVDGRRYEVKVVFGNNDIGGAQGIDHLGNIYTAENKVFVAGITDIYGTTGDSFYRPYNNNVGPNSTNHMVPSGNTNITTGFEYQNSFVFNQASNNGSTALRLQFEFVNGQSYSKSLEILSVSFTEQPASYILEYDIKTDTVKPVVVDLQNQALQFLSSNLITGINIVDGLLFWTDGVNEPKKINIERCKSGTTDFTTNTQLLVQDLPVRDLELKDITVIKKAPKTPLVVKKIKTRDATGQYAGVVIISDANSTYNSIINSSQGNDIHNFQSLNVGDTFQVIIETDYYFSNDFSLSWSDGDTVILKAFDSQGVPPQFPLELYDNWHIKGYITNWIYNRFENVNSNLLESPLHTNYAGWAISTGGTALEGPHEHTGGTNNQKLHYFTHYNSNGQEIKQGRHYKITFDLGLSSNSNLQGKLAVMLKNKDNEQVAFYFNELTSGDVGTHELEVDDTPLFTNGATTLFTGQTFGSINGVQFESKTSATNVVFEGEISNVKVERIDQFPAKAEIQITNINGTPPIPQGGDTQLEYLIDVSTTADILFEKKLPRFSYRYKYEDGEYSTFAPFTNVVFSPGTFGYLPTDGFNSGMNNTVKSLTLESINDNKPDDVVSVDILYKEEGSPSVYVVDTLKGGESYYEIKKETINGILPDNQILRLWDNVPINALSQEVVGNRIIYGNYTQNYNLSSTDSSLNDYNLNLSVNVNSLPFGNDNYGRSSIKSLREYQLGVVYTDSYGRETPVLTNSSSTIKLDKSFSDEQNSFLVQIKTNGHPINMEYFKFYVKDTGGEYYNMAMDRYFDAEDGNVWLSFPSVDRNKIDIDDNIILKKGIDSNSVLNKARYKVLDISNEAPDYIKKQESLVMKKYHGSGGNELFTVPPQLDGSTFQLDPAKFTNSIHQNFVSHYNNRPSGVDYYVIFSHNSFNNVSQKYKIKSFESDSNTYVGVEGKFGFDVMQFTDDPTGLAVNEVLEQSYLSIVKEELVNSPKFDGRFFVKIKKDVDFNKIDPNLTLSTEYVTTADTTKKIYSANSAVNDDENHPTDHGGKSQFWEGYSSADSTGDFELGRSATKTILGVNDPQIGTLKDYWETRIEMLQDLGDYDYALDGTSTSAPGYSAKDSIEGTMMAWRAYFRGLNTETLPTYSMDPSSGRNNIIDIDVDADNNKFEDVWFISTCKHAASIPTDRGLEVSNSYPQTSTTDPTVWTPRNGGWESWSSTSSSALELSFGGISPNSWENQHPPNRPDNDYSFFDIGQGNLNYAAANGEFVKNLSAGSRFMFKEDPTKTVYTITDVHLYHKIMYDNLEEATTHSPPDNENHYKGQVLGLKGDNDICDDSGALPVKYRCTSFLDASNFVVIYKLFLDKEAVWDPMDTDLNIQIANGLKLKLAAADGNPIVTKTNGDANIKVDSITAVDTVTGEVHKLEVGLVLWQHATHALGDDKAIITHIVDNLDGTFTLRFKCYRGNQRDLGTSGNGKFGGISTTDDLYFAQYSMNRVSKNSAKNINYFHDAGVSKTNVGIDALGYTMQFLTAATSENEDNVLSSTDPAIFETEPKKDKDLDVYYEASRAIPIVDNAQNIANLIPVGSIVEHEGSNAIPINTTIDSISSSGVITLSNDVNVENTIPIYREDQFDGV